MPPVAAIAIPILTVTALAATTASAVATLVAPRSSAARIAAQVAGAATVGTAVSKFIVSKDPAFQFPGLAPGEVPAFVTEIGDLTPLLQTIATIADFAGKAIPVLSEGIGDRLERLAGTGTNLLDQLLRTFFPEQKELTNAAREISGGILQALFPEIARTGRALDHMIFNQLPFGFSGIQTGVRQQGVSQRTLAIMKARGLVPRNITRNPDGFDVNGGGEPDVATVPLEELPERTVPGPLPPPGEVLGDLTGMSPEIGGQEFLGVVTGEGLRAVGSGISTLAKDILEGLFTVVAPLGQGIMETAGSLMAGGRDLASATFGAVGISILEGVESDLSSAGPVGPGEQKEIVRRALGNAFALGVGAHLTASLAEILMPLKHLGLPQIAALMVDLAGFGSVVAASHGPLIQHAIRVPAEHEARRTFRSALPDLGMAKQFVLERLIGLEDYAELLRFNGLSEAWIEVYKREVWEEPSLRELTNVVDDTPVDEGWLLRKITETGLSDEDVGLFFEGLQRRSNRTLRQGYIAELVTTFKEGLLTQEELEGEFDRLNLNAAARDLLRRRAALQRRRDLAGEMVTALRKQAEEQLITDDDFRTALAGLGFDEERITVLAAVAQSTIGIKALREERADIKTLVRQEQRQRIDLAVESFRRRQITRLDLSRFLQSIGLTEAHATVASMLEEIRLEPVPRVPPRLTPEAQLAKENEILADAALEAFRKGQIDEIRVRTILTSLQVPRRELEAAIALEIVKKSPIPGVIEKAEAARLAAKQEREAAAAAAKQEREAAALEQKVRTIRTNAARELFHQEQISADGLLQLLLSLGHEEGVAEALTELEVIKAEKGPARRTSAP